MVKRKCSIVHVNKRVLLECIQLFSVQQRTCIITWESSTSIVIKIKFYFVDFNVSVASFRCVFCPKSAINTARYSCLGYLGMYVISEKYCNLLALTVFLRRYFLKNDIRVQIALKQTRYVSKCSLPKHSSSVANARLLNFFLDVREAQDGVGRGPGGTRRLGSGRIAPRVHVFHAVK